MIPDSIRDLAALDRIAEFDLDEDAFPVQVSEGLDILKPCMDYHLQRLVDGRNTGGIFVIAALRFIN